MDCQIQQNILMTGQTGASVLLISRHTVVCRAAQEAGAQPREYIDRKKENAIFAPP